MKLGSKTSSASRVKTSLQQSVNPNHEFQEPDQEIFTIPTLVNGVTRKTPLTANPDNYCLSINEMKNHIDNLRTSIKYLNMSDSSSNSVHKVILNGDGHIKGFVKSVQSVLNSDSMIETVKQLSFNNILVVSSGTNDYELNNFNSTFRNIKNYLFSITNTNIVLFSVLFRYDLHNSGSVNRRILTINKKLNKLTKTSPFVSFIYCNNNRNLFTQHGLHRNKLGDNLLVTLIANHILTINVH